MTYTNIDIVQALDKLRINNLYVHNDELKGATFKSSKLSERKVYLVETLAVINATVLKSGKLNIKTISNNDPLSLTGSTIRVKLSDSKILLSIFV